MLDQQTREINNVEVLLPPGQGGKHIPSISLPQSPLDWPVERFTEALDRRETNRQSLLKWIASNLKEGVDYGRIHVMGKNKCEFAKAGKAYECKNKYHWSKPSLFKPGSEKICGMLGLTVKFPNLCEYEKAVIKGLNIKVIILKCHLVTSTGFTVAEGSGARSVSQDNNDMNKSLKMAMKSSHIDACLRACGLSEIFTQDLEDMFGNQGADGSKASKKPEDNQKNAADTQTKGSSNVSEDESADAKENEKGRITWKQYHYILKLAKSQAITKSDLNKMSVEIYGVVVEYLTIGEASSLIEQLKSE